MNLSVYTSIITAMCVVPPILALIIGGIACCCFHKGDGLMLLMMKGTIGKYNINQTPSYLFCGRKIPPPSRKYFVIYSLLILIVCVQCFSLLFVFDVTHDCLNDPNLDCFREIDEITLASTALDQSPLNCSAIAKDDLVFCYRTTAFDPEQAFFSAAAAYLLFEIINVGLVALAYVMFFIAEKIGNLVKVKIIMTFILLASFVGGTYLRTTVAAFGSATRKLSFTVLVQSILVLLFVFLYVIVLPWEKFSKSVEYFPDASLPTTNQAHAKEATVTDEHL